jgi:hypothetical protein
VAISGALQRGVKRSKGWLALLSIRIDLRVIALGVPFVDNIVDRLDVTL